MKVLLIGATGNLGIRLVAALLTHGHSVVAFVRSSNKLESLLPTSVYRQIAVVQGDATDPVSIKRAILDASCDAVVNTAGLAALPPWGKSELPAIFHAVLDAVREAGLDRKKPLRTWFLAGMGVLYYPGSESMLSNYVPIYLEHRQNLHLLKSLPLNTLDWSMLCPSTMTPESSDINVPTKTLHGKLIANAATPPSWQDSWIKYIPLIGKTLLCAMNARRYETTLEQNAEFIASDLESYESRWSGMTVGVIDESNFLGGAVAVTIYSTIFNSKIKTALPAQLSTAAINAGLPASSLPKLILAFTSGNAGAFQSIPGVTPDVIAALTAGSRQAYADSFRYIWSRELDMACPNATRHSKSSQHELNLDQFHNLLRRQLDRSHTHAIGYLGLGGSSGHMFAITLCSHGYTFVGKGSRSDQVPTLAHELGIYETIHPLQGNSIPVCLGLLELEGPYYLPSPNHLTHFLLLSSGGFWLSRWSKLLPPAVDIISSARTALKKLHDFNLTHCDLRAENLLWSTELQCVMIVDFGESALLEIPDVSPSVRYHVSSGQKRNRGVVQVDVKSCSSAGVRKTRKTRYRHRDLKFLMGERRCELAAVEMEVLRWLSARAT